MKFCFLVLFAFCFGVCSRAQTEDVIHYQDIRNGFSFDYPAEWDSAYLSKLKAHDLSDKMHLAFGAMIKPSYLSNGTGAVFMISVDTLPHKLDSIGMVREKENTDDFYKDVENGKLEYSAITKTKKNGLPVLINITKADFGGFPTYLYNYEIYKGKIKYTLVLNSHEFAYPKLKEPFEKIADTFICE